MGNPLPESTLTLCQSRLHPPVKDFGFGLWLNVRQPIPSNFILLSDQTWCMRGWDHMPELTITSPYVHSRVDSNTFTLCNPMPESILTLCQSCLFLPVKGLWIWPLHKCQTTSTLQFYVAFRPNNIILMIRMRRNRFFILETSDFLEKKVPWGYVTT